MQAALLVKELRSRLAGPFELSLGRGNCAAITGPSGSGKSLFLRMIADLDPNEGQVWLEGSERNSMPAPQWREVAARPERRFKDQSNFAIGFVSVGFATFVTAILALTTAIRPQPWFDPHYAIPLAGIILGNVLNSASLSLDSFLGSVQRERLAIEARLSLGESYRDSIAPLVRDAIRRGLLPIINQMSAAGIVTLPGIMTGQILAGLDPLEAVKYQILLMFLLSGGSGLSALATSYLAAWRLTDERQRLRLDRLQ